ncbi:MULTISPECIES: ABC transporter ATP-binding protein [unclassified Clostridium]|uniref:Lipid A export ATP-binding/permease protein MsbA n=1 Tax=Clostridium botulinum (strain Eklund 17B / Type B) TaxID=935198 RepID=B2TNC0_CLOBB|nr:MULTISPECIES: ABC transporter ATP-binding protein [unclassified Clostridium]ACD24806.1 lipid A export ATP-binding/permease protein MsbA [Clostridium botulinum B str. Eklund 17B (NRP)]MBY6976053.1 ABC transporter ATP-binding protein [Clostridium botulinum]MBY7000475.1 ABC transporter ATP-binding protein [Clostridium botulinum]MCR1273237.1 ABC transporter ATP-binding protein/permease [Clostridium botulinum]NFD70335.1 ABC transporter ATP-binding protein [Clostridium botulinum]
MLKKFISFYKPYKKLFFMDLIAAFIAALCDLVYPMMTRTLVNDSIPNKNIRLIVVFAVTLLIIFLIKALCGYFMQYWGHVVGVRMQGDMRRDVFNHLQKLPNKYFDNNKTGDIMSRIINDLMEISELAHHGPEDIFISLVMLTGSFIILCTINIPLTLLIFAFIPFIVLFTMYQRKKMNKAFLDTKVKTGAINASLENSISGISISKAFVSHETEQEKFEKGNKKFILAREKAYKVMAEYFSGAGFGIDILNYVGLIGGGLFTFKGIIDIGDFMAYMLYIRLFTDPIKKLINFMEQFQNGITGFQRYMEIMNEDQEKNKKNAIELRDVKGNIEFKNVGFSYEGEKVLDDFSIDIESGKMLALVGHSGGGKTTICNLIPRFYDVMDGDIRIDGKSIYDVTLDSLRENIGIVQQEVFLFTGTIRDNILYGKTNASEEEIIKASKMANIHEFIESLPEGYDTYIGERGVKLSGGQKQRISIARVFLKNPSILILDEATSALDNTTEHIIQESLKKLCEGRTTIVVAHRLSTIQNADEIVVIGNKGIIEKGSHNELMKLNGEYNKLQKITSI